MNRYISENISVKVFIGTMTSADAKALELRQEDTIWWSDELVNLRSHYDVSKYSFSVSIVDAHNTLPSSVISENDVNTFKHRSDRDRFWANQELIFDHKGTLTETGNRCFVDSFDIDTF